MFETLESDVFHSDTKSHRSFVLIVYLDDVFVEIVLSDDAQNPCHLDFEGRGTKAVVILS